MNQNDNQRLGARGHGLELATRAWGAVRAGSGLLISSHGKPASTHSAGGGGGQQMDSTEPLARLQAGQELLHTLAQSAQDHQALIAGEPQVKGATEKDKGRQLATEQGLWATQAALKTRQTVGDSSSAQPEPNSVRAESNSVRAEPNSSRAESNSVRAEPNSVRAEPNSVRAEPVEASAQIGGENPQAASIGGENAQAATIGGENPQAATIGGGVGTVTAWSRPDLVLASPAGIALATPQSGITSAGHTVAVMAGLDINQLAAHHWALAAKDGIVLYTYGQASNAQKPNQETGIQLHAASGNVNSQSQSGATHVAADKAVSVSSTAAGITASAPKHILLAAGGAGIKISAGNITLSAPGSITFKAGMKNFTGGASASAGLNLVKPGALNLPRQDLMVSLIDADGQSPAGEAVKLLDGASKEHQLSVGAGGAVAAAFKPGAAKAGQARRKQ